MFTLGQASSFNGSHVTFPSQAVVGTVVQPLVISSGSYNTANPPSKSLTLFIEVGLFSVSPNFVDLYMQSDGPLQEDTEEGVQSSAQFLFFLFLHHSFNKGSTTLIYWVPAYESPVLFLSSKWLKIHRMHNAQSL